MEYTIQNEKTVFDDRYRIIKAKVTYDTFNGKTITTERLAFERGDSVAILLIEKDTNNILLTKQFRYPTTKHGKGWLVEIPAGSVEKDEDPKDCIIREVKEELGYRISKPKVIQTFYPSPGAATERIILFTAEVSSGDKISKGGGNEGESEDIELIKLHISKIKDEIPKLTDAKTVLALQYFLLNQTTEE